MARPPRGDASAIHPVTTKFTEAELAAIERQRGNKPRSTWIHDTVVANLVPDHRHQRVKKSSRVHKGKVLTTYGCSTPGCQWEVED